MQNFARFDFMNHGRKSEIRTNLLFRLEFSMLDGLTLMSTLWIITALEVLVGAIAVDILFGEPRAYLQPSMFVRRVSNYFDKFFRHGNLVYMGLAFLFFIVVLYALPIWVLLYVVAPISVVYVVIGIVVLKVSFSITSVREHVRPIIEALEKGSMMEARVYLGRLVHRDTEHLDEAQISSAAIESVAKALIYGFVSPLLYFSVFGIIGAFIVKVINSLDAVIGHRDKKNFEFGRATAVVHSIINYVPSRVAAFLILFSSELLNYKVKSIPLRRTVAMPESVNTGWTMGAMATSLNLRLEKVGSYVLNRNGFAPTVTDVKRALNIYYISSYTFLIIFVVPIMIVLYVLFI